MQAHEIDYHIFGEEMQYVEIELDPQEIVVAEAGSFMMMDNGIKMETIFGDGSDQQQSGVFGKLLSAGKRVLTGESLFMTAYINQNRFRGMKAYNYSVNNMSIREYDTFLQFAEKQSTQKIKRVIQNYINLRKCSKYIQTK